MMNRVFTMVLRYWFSLKTSPVRLIKHFCWPVVQVLTWGIFSSFMAGNSSWFAKSAGVFLAAIMLWDTMFRCQDGIMEFFLEEIWTRHLRHLFTTPLSPAEFASASMLVGILRTFISLIPTAITAAFLYNYNILSMGLPLLAFFGNLMLMGWWFGLFMISAMLMFGLEVEAFAWMASAIIMPISAVYYPVSALPAWLQPMALSLPVAHVFEGMRGVLFGQGFMWGHFWAALILNLVCFALASLAFTLAFERARVTGKLLNSGE